MSAAIPFGTDTDHFGYQAKNLRIHNISGSVDFVTPRGGMIGFMAANGDKRLAFWDDQLSQLIKVPRLDRGESVTHTWTFAPSGGGAPFAVGSTTKVENLNADLLDGFNSSVTASANTIALRDGAGRLKVAAPSADDDAANKGWVIDTVYGITAAKQECRVRATGNVSISSAPAANNAVWDGLTLANGDRILLVAQTNKAQNGIYVYNGSGVAMTRAADADTSEEVNPGMTVFVTSGDVWRSSRWQLVTEDPIVLGTTELEFVQIGGGTDFTAGPGLGKSGTELYVKLGSAGSPTGRAYTSGSIVYTDSTSTLNTLTRGGVNTLLGVNGAGNGHEYKSLTGTTNQITVTNTGSTITLALPQAIHTAATPTFSSVTLNGLTASQFVRTGSGKTLESFDLFGGENTWIGTNTFLQDVTIRNGTAGRVLNIGPTASGNNSNAGTIHLYTGGGKYWHLVTRGDQHATSANQLSLHYYNGTSFSEFMRFLPATGSYMLNQLSTGFVRSTSGSLSAFDLFGTANTWSASQTFARGTSSENALNTGVSGDAFARFNIRADGYISWGTGGAAADLALHRSDTSVLTVTGNLAITGLSASTLVQTNANGRLISSNNLPSSTTIASVAIARKVTASIGNGSSTSFTINHNLNTRDVKVEVYDDSLSTKDTVIVPVQRSTVNSVVVYFGSAPASNQYRVVITG